MDDSRPYDRIVWEKHTDNDLEEFIKVTSEKLLSDSYHMVLNRFPPHERDRMLDQITTYITDAQNELDKRKAS